MILYANGCSMTYGSELFDDPVTRLCLDNDLRQRAAWPGQLGALLGCDEVYNDAVPSGSNDRIVRRTIEWVLHRLANGTEAADLLVVIGWSSPMRREFVIDGEWRQLIPYHDYRDPGLNALNRIYREVAWDDAESAERFALQIVALQTVLGDRLGIDYLFFDALSASEELVAAERGAPATVATIDGTHYRRFREPSADMGTYLRAQFPDSSRTHPSLEGHAAWAAMLARERCASHAVELPAQRSHPIVSGTGDHDILDVKVGLAPQAPGRHLGGPPPSPDDTTSTRSGPTTSARVVGRVKRAFDRQPFIYE